MRKVDVAILGAGTAGLTARKQVEKVSSNYVVIDGGTLGTTCARVGCMPSKVFIQAANDFERKSKFEQMGISGGEHLKVDPKKLMIHVRSLRDRFVRGVLGPMPSWDSHFIPKFASFIDSHTLDLGDEKIHAEKIIIATGSRPILPQAWLEYKDFLIDTNSFFELETLPKRMAVIGLGVIGLELGQALSRLDVDVTGISLGRELGGITDPELQDYIVNKLEKEFPLYLDGAKLIGVKNNLLQIDVGNSQVVEVEKALISVGRRANIDKLGIDSLGIPLDPNGVPFFDSNTFQLKDAPHIFIAGDVNNQRPILHEAADEGTIAGYNAVNEVNCFRRRTPLGITFSDPNIAFVGKRYIDLKKEGIAFVEGKVSFEGQGRSIVKLKEQGLLKVYGEKSTGKVLGAELQAPDGEHLAHLLAWAISLNLNVKEMLFLPFYHPVVEEGLRTALRDLASKIENGPSQLELMRCLDAPLR